MPNQAMSDRLAGVGASPGRAAGPVYRKAEPPTFDSLTPQQRELDAPVTAEQAIAALCAVSDDLAHRSASARNRGRGVAADVLRTQSMIAADSTLANDVTARIAAGRDGSEAIAEAIERYKELLTTHGGYLAERAADLDDIRHRALAYALELPQPGVPDPGRPFILVADDLFPSDTALLDPTSVIALVTRRGGPTSHTAILAKSLGIPAVVGCAGALDLADGAVVSVDGSTGQVRRVSAKQAARIQDHARLARERLAATTGPGRTRDGHPVPLLLNIGSAADVQGVDQLEGVGLFRTEFLYLGRSDTPSATDQEQAYHEVFAAVGPRKVVLRTLDAGADKPLPFLSMPDEANPALGVRGIRVTRNRPELLTSQLEAVAAAAKARDADVWVMAPMVTTRAEAEAFATQVHAAGLDMAGVMIEVPAAALQAHRILEVVDFLSIGTNDLSQYTLAADRTNAELADLLDHWQPALLQLIGACAAAGTAAGKPVGVCGEAASDPVLALVLVGLGITTLSMSPPSVAAVRASLARHTLDQCRHLADLALAARDAAEARATVAASTAAES